MSGFKDHFSRQSETYANARPRYPAALFDWLASESPDRETAWDIGCGNGQASVGLASQFKRVVACDPSEAQIRNAMPYPRIDYRVQAAESATLPAASVDLLIVAQALHWFDLDAFYASAMPALKPGALFAAWCYGISSVSPEVDAVFERLYRGPLDAFWPPERGHIENHYADLALPFDDSVEAPPLSLQAEWNAGQYLAYLRSWSASQRHLDATGVDAVAEITGDLRAAFGEQRRTVRWPLTIKACRKPVGE
ncbi:MAG: class I SAM-dependent methyltransferase [Lysobacteraceae bacterium]